MSERFGVDPTEISVDRQKGILTIAWKDGHFSSYTCALLRDSCPCAACNHQRAQQSISELRVLPAGASEDSYRVEEVRRVGRYALQFLWKDGHNTGIYAFEFLRRLCPCGSCLGRTEGRTGGDSA